MSTTQQYMPIRPHWLLTPGELLRTATRVVELERAASDGSRPFADREDARRKARELRARLYLDGRERRRRSTPSKRQDASTQRATSGGFAPCVPYWAHK